MMKSIITILSISLLFVFHLHGQNEWDVNNPEGDWGFTSVSLKSDEGTWVSVDVSPDGKQIVFDVLGDIFIMPISGGKAKPLRTGLAWESQPEFSPDGTKIAFTSDAGGGDNIWIMNSDGSDAKQVTTESFRLLNNPVWTPDGEYLIARKHFTSTRSLGAGEMWMYHITGGSGIQLSKRKNDQQDVNEPEISKDGKYLFYSEVVYPGGYFQYNKDPNKQIYVIYRYEFETGERKRYAGGNGSASRPVISNDGSKLAFIKRVREKTVLYIQDLETGKEWPIYDKMEKDQIEAWAIFGTYPGFDWTPDDKNLIFWAGGKINKISLDNSQTTIIPFEIDTKIKIAEALRYKQNVFSEEFTSKAIRQTVTSPDNSWIIFNAAGYLWKKDLKKGRVERLTNSTHMEYEPSFSQDGNTVCYVTWDDAEMGAIYTLDWKNKKALPQKVTSEKGIYRTPSFSADGKSIVFVREGGNSQLGPALTRETGIYTVDAKGGNPKFIKSSGNFPQYNKNGDRIYFQTGGYFGGSITKTLRSVDLSGNNEITHVSSKYANRIIPSPDEKWIALIHLHNVYLAAFPKTGRTLDLNPGSKAVPVTKITRDAGLYVHWSANSKRVNWTLGDEYFSNNIYERFTFLENSPDSLPPVDTVGIKIGLTLNSDKPEGIIAFTNARIITMKGEQVIENGTLVVDGNKITAVGQSDEIKIPSKAKTYNLEGKTIIPGLVDVHAHLGHFRVGISPQKQWQYYANLAYGVTTSHDPSAATEMVFSQAEMVRTGTMLGPRIFSTGWVLYGADGDFKAVINNLDDARAAVRRTKAFGAISVKSYNQPRRNQRQQVIKAAREEGVMVVPEGGSTFFHNMSMIMDGHTGIEHNIPVGPIYKDVKTLWKNSKTGYTPTLLVNYGGINAEYYWYQNQNVWENERLLKFTPRSVIDSRSRHRTMIPEEEYKNGHILTAEVCKELNDVGVKVNMGAHGQLQGLGAHWETWSLVQGGMTNMEALRSATLNGAHYLGMDHAIGSLEEGKLADLVVLDKNPLDNIQNTNSVNMTMVNGRLYEAATLNETGNYDVKREEFYWEDSKYDKFGWHDNVFSESRPICSCGNH